MTGDKLGEFKEIEPLKVETLIKKIEVIKQKIKETSEEIIGFK